MTKSHSRGGPKGRGEGLGRNFKSCGKEKGISPDPGAWRSSGVQGEMQKPHLCLGLLEGDRSVQPQRAVWAEVTRQGQGPRALGRWQHKCPQAAVQDPSAFRAQAKSGTTRSQGPAGGKERRCWTTDPGGPRCSAVTRETPHNQLHAGCCPQPA